MYGIVTDSLKADIIRAILTSDRFIVAFFSKKEGYVNLNKDNNIHSFEAKTKNNRVAAN